MLVFNGSGLLVVTGRDNSATRQICSSARREPSWPRGLEERPNSLKNYSGRKAPPVGCHGAISGRMATRTTMNFGVSLRSTSKRTRHSWESPSSFVGPGVGPTMGFRVPSTSEFGCHAHTCLRFCPSQRTRRCQHPRRTHQRPRAQASRGLLPRPATCGTEKKIREGVTKADLARLLEAEARKAVKAGQLGRTLKASYIENQLSAWGIWPLNSFK